MLFRSIRDPLTESVLEEREVTYAMVEGGSQKTTKVLVSSDGYAYSIKVSKELKKYLNFTLQCQKTLIRKKVSTV